MKKHLKWIIPLVCVCLVFGGFGIKLWVDNSNKGPEITYVTSITLCDPNSPEEMVGFADHVFVGYVEDVVKTTYEYPDPDDKEFEIPHTHYSVTVLKNIKGELVQGEPISFSKFGGESSDGKYITLETDDFFPEEKNVYVFVAYAQKDGSLRVGRLNSNIPLGENDSKANFEKSEIVKKYEKAFENQEFVRPNRERFVTKYDVNYLKSEK